MTDSLLMKKQRPTKFVHSEETTDIWAISVVSTRKCLRLLSKQASVLKITCTCSHILTCFAMWHTVKWITLPVFHYSSPTIPIAEAIPEMHISTFFTCKQVRHFDHNTVMQCNTATATIQDSAQALTWPTSCCAS